MFKRFTSSVPNKEENKEEDIDQVIKKFRELLGKDNERYDDAVSFYQKKIPIVNTLFHYKNNFFP
jgi:hypothetical protein